MVGHGVLRECLLAADVSEVLSICRREVSAQALAAMGPGISREKLSQMVRADFFDYSDELERLRGYDACLFCLGVSSYGMDEATYRHMTYDLTLAAAKALVEVNPAMTFVYVSGAGTDAAGKSMWMRVKGETENALLALPFRAAYLFRPGVIQPLHGSRSKTLLYRSIYVVFRPVFPLLKRLMPGKVTTTEQVGRAMLAVARDGYSKRVLESDDITGF